MRIRIWYLVAALMVTMSLAACGAPATSAPATTAPQAVVPTPTTASVATATTAPKAANPTVPPANAATTTAAPKAANPTAARAQPTAAAKSQAATTSKLDIDKLLPNASGRAEMLDYCVGCHHIAAIAIAAKPKEEWLAHKKGHIGRTVMPDAIYDKIYDYLIANYPPDRKIPELPPELLSDWTSY